MRHILYTLFLVLALAGAGCSDKSKGGSGGDDGYNYDGSGNGVPPVTDPIIDVINGGTDTPLTLVSKSVVDQYLGWTTNYPSDNAALQAAAQAQVALNLKLFGWFPKAGVDGSKYCDPSKTSFDAAKCEPAYGGSVIVKMKYGTGTSAHLMQDTFRSDTFGDGYCGPYGDCNTVSGSVKNHKYNLLSSEYPGMNGEMGYHGFFEDDRVIRLAAGLQQMGGAVIVVIDSTNDSGDGQGPTSANGSIWFKNYFQNIGNGPIPLTHCWFISEGPYDCRSWKSGDGVNTKQNIYPTNGYVKLGNFVNADVQKAFNNEL